VCAGTQLSITHLWVRQRRWLGSARHGTGRATGAWVGVPLPHPHRTAPRHGWPAVGGDTGPSPGLAAGPGGHTGGGGCILGERARGVGAAGGAKGRGADRSHGVGGARSNTAGGGLGPDLCRTRCGGRVRRRPFPALVSPGAGCVGRVGIPVFAPVPVAAAPPALGAGAHGGGGSGGCCGGTRPCTATLGATQRVGPSPSLLSLLQLLLQRLRCRRGRGGGGRGMGMGMGRGGGRGEGKVKPQAHNPASCVPNEDPTCSPPTHTCSPIPTPVAPYPHL
jgi:hypothetical protein